MATVAGSSWLMAVKKSFKKTRRKVSYRALDCTVSGGNVFASRGFFMGFNVFRGMFSSDLSIDLGTANTLISVRGEGLVLD